MKILGVANIVEGTLQARNMKILGVVEFFIKVRKYFRIMKMITLLVEIFGLLAKVYTREIVLLQFLAKY